MRYHRPEENGLGINYIFLMILIMLLMFGCATVVYRCPPGQVKLLFDKGMTSEREACFTPGVTYCENRSFTTEVVK